jgi:hypothetical protein
MFHETRAFAPQLPEETLFRETLFRKTGRGTPSSRPLLVESAYSE